MSKTNTGLVEYAKAQLGLPYWYGTFGNKATKSLLNSKKKQYPKHYTSERMPRYETQIGKRVHDCVGLIKGYLWSTSPTATPKYNASQDVSANGMLSKCMEKGKISTMPDIPGVLVFMDGHVGVYAGNGYVIEARGFNYGVVKTKLSDRPWTNWGKCPWIDYGTEEAKKPVTENKSEKKSIDEIAREVIEGKWGTGTDRKNRLTKAGYNYNEVQARVNEMLKKPATGNTGFTATVVCNLLNVRRGPGTNYTVVKTIRRGTNVKIVETKGTVGQPGSWGKTTDGYWISLNGNYVRKI